MSFNSLPLEGKVGGGLRRSDEVAKFYLSKFNNIRLYFFSPHQSLARQLPLKGKPWLVSLETLVS